MQPVYVVGCFARTPVGLTAAATAAAVRAGISRSKEHPVLVDSSGKPLRLALDALLDPEALGRERMAALTLPPLMEATSAVFAATTKEVPVFLGEPEVRPGWQGEDAVALRSALLGRLASQGVKAKLHAAAQGHASGLAAINKAATAIAHEHLDVCVAGSFDSYMSLDTLRWLDQTRRLATHRSRSGFIPGEGAAFVILASAGAARAMRRPHLATVRGSHSCHESKVSGSDQDNLGEGLAAALSHAASTLTPAERPIDGVYCDLNGERFRSDEWAFALLRRATLFADGTRYVAPAGSWGDTGAASGTLSCILATQAWQRGHAPGRFALAWGSSDRGLRSAVVLENGGV